MSSKFPSYNNKTLRFRPEVTRFHLHAVLPVPSMALISHRNVQNGPQTLFLTTVPGLQSLALILSLQGLLSLTPLPFHNLILNCRSKKTALPTILAINLGCRPESISTIPSLLEVLPGNPGTFPQCLPSSSTSLFSMPERKVASD